MDTYKIIPIFIIISIAIIAVYRIIPVLSGSAPRRTKIIRGISMLVGIIFVIVLGGLQIFHIIP